MKSLIAILILFLSLKSVARITRLADMVKSPLNIYIQNLQKTPLDSIFEYHSVATEEDSRKYRRQLNIYRGFYLESVSLVNYCSSPREIEFSKFRDKMRFLRNIVATLQNIGIRKTIPAIVEYTKKLHYTEEGFENLVDNLIGNYCSPNLSLMSIRKVKETFFTHHRKKDVFNTPSLGNNPFFPNKLDLINSNEGINENELFYTIELFKSFCSWGGDPTDLRLMTPLLKNPLIFSYLIRELTEKELDWDESSKEIVLINSERSNSVLCHGFICRPSNGITFKREMPKSVGSDSLLYDLEKIYCSYFSTINYKYPQSDKKLERLMKDRASYDESFLTAQFLALITGTPDLLLRAKKFNEVFNYLDISIDEHFDLWAKRELKKMENYLYYEDSLKIKKMDRGYYFNYKVPKFTVEFDVSLGEWDRSVYKNGKIKMSFDLNFPKSLARWVINEYKFIKTGDSKKVLEIEKRVLEQVKFKRQGVQTKLRFPLWNNKIDIIVARELINQLLLYNGRFFNLMNEEILSIPITFYVGPFALKYLNYKHKVDKEQKDLILSK